MGIFRFFSGQFLSVLRMVVKLKYHQDFSWIAYKQVTLRGAVSMHRIFSTLCAHSGWQASFKDFNGTSGDSDLTTGVFVFLLVASEVRMVIGNGNFEMPFAAIIQAQFFRFCTGTAPIPLWRAAT